MRNLSSQYDHALASSNDLVCDRCNQSLLASLPARLQSWFQLGPPRRSDLQPRQFYGSTDNVRLKRLGFILAHMLQERARQPCSTL